MRSLFIALLAIFVLSLSAPSSHAQAIATATTNGAALLGMEKSLGATSPGYFADLVAVEGDPLTDIGAITHGVRRVMKGGRVVVDRTGGQSSTMR